MPVATTRSKRRRLSTATTTRATRTYMLRGLARCAICGQVMWCTPGSSGRRYRDASRLKARPCETRFESVGADVIEGQVAELISRLRLPHDWQERIVTYAGQQEDAVAVEARSRYLKDKLA